MNTGNRFFAVGALCAVLAVFAPAPANAASCGTVAAPTACSDTMSGTTLTFDNFTFFSSLSGVGSGAQIAAGDVNVDLINNGSSITLQLTPNQRTWAFTGTQLQQMFVGYQVTLSGASGIGWVSSGFSDMFTGVPGGFGAGSQTKDICTGGPCGSQGSVIVSTANVNDQGGTAGVQGSYSSMTAPVFSSTAPSMFWVRDTISLQANNQSVLAFSFDNTYGSDVPEPTTFALIGGALIGLAFTRRKTSSKA